MALPWWQHHKHCYYYYYYYILYYYYYYSQAPWWQCVVLSTYQTDNAQVLALNPLMATRKPQSSGPSYGDWYGGRWWVGCYIWYSEKGLGGAQSPAHCTKYNSHTIRYDKKLTGSQLSLPHGLPHSPPVRPNGQYTNFILFDVAL